VLPVCRGNIRDGLEIENDQTLETLHQKSTVAIVTCFIFAGREEWSWSILQFQPIGESRVIFDSRRSASKRRVVGGHDAVVNQNLAIVESLLTFQEDRLRLWRYVELQ
jgi:hypothetical protein